jgi:hypothetical protein
LAGQLGFLAGYPALGVAGRLVKRAIRAGPGARRGRLTRGKQRYDFLFMFAKCGREFKVWPGTAAAKPARFDVKLSAGGNRLFETSCGAHSWSRPQSGVCGAGSTEPSDLQEGLVLQIGNC